MRVRLALSVGRGACATRGPLLADQRDAERRSVYLLNVEEQEELQRVHRQLRERRRGNQTMIQMSVYQMTMTHVTSTSSPCSSVGPARSSKSTGKSTRPARASPREGGLSAGQTSQSRATPGPPEAAASRRLCVSTWTSSAVESSRLAFGRSSTSCEGSAGRVLSKGKPATVLNANVILRQNQLMASIFFFHLFRWNEVHKRCVLTCRAPNKKGSMRGHMLMVSLSI